MSQNKKTFFLLVGYVSQGGSQKTSKFIEKQVKKWWSKTSRIKHNMITNQIKDMNMSKKKSPAVKKKPHDEGEEEHFGEEEDQEGEEEDDGYEENDEEQQDNEEEEHGDEEHARDDEEANRTSEDSGHEEHHSEDVEEGLKEWNSNIKPLPSSSAIETPLAFTDLKRKAVTSEWFTLPSTDILSLEGSTVGRKSFIYNIEMKQQEVKRISVEKIVKEGEIGAYTVHEHHMVYMLNGDTLRIYNSKDNTCIRPKIMLASCYERSQDAYKYNSLVMHKDMLYVLDQEGRLLGVEMRGEYKVKVLLDEKEVRCIAMEEEKVIGVYGNGILMLYDVHKLQMIKEAKITTVKEMSCSICNEDKKYVFCAVSNMNEKADSTVTKIMMIRKENFKIKSTVSIEGELARFDREWHTNPVVNLKTFRSSRCKFLLAFLCYAHFNIFLIRRGKIQEMNTSDRDVEHAGMRIFNFEAFACVQVDQKNKKLYVLPAALEGPLQNRGIYCFSLNIRI